MTTTKNRNEAKNKNHPHHHDHDLMEMGPKWRQLLKDGPEADKDNLIQLIFSSLDHDSNFILNYTELYQVSTFYLSNW